jgi:hypothetical protein
MFQQVRMFSTGTLQEAADKIEWVWYLLFVVVVLALIIGQIYQKSKTQQKITEKHTSFDSLANADPAEVKNVLTEAGLQMMNPEGWIDQAEFAAKEDGDGLQKLPKKIKKFDGGTHVFSQHFGGGRCWIGIDMDPDPGSGLVFVDDYCGVAGQPERSRRKRLADPRYRRPRQ